MQLEDEFGDVVGKARRGQEIEVKELARQAGLSAAQVEKIESYEWTPAKEEIVRLAGILGLHPEKLQASAAGSYFPLYPAGRPVENLVVKMMVLGKSFQMNGYVVGCIQSNKGAIVDPGFDAEKILKTVEAAGLDIEVVLLTHGHGDHIGALSEICQATSASALINQADLGLLGGLRTKIEGGIAEGETIEVGRQRFVARATPGHTPGGMSLVHEEVAFVGDALFAGSLGGTRSRGDYEAQRRSVGDKLLGLDERLVLYPGHGPASTVGEECAHNPFFS